MSPRSIRRSGIASIILPIKELKRLVLICLHLAKNAITIAGDIERLSMC
jgi:hypothetical protein